MGMVFVCGVTGTSHGDGSCVLLVVMLLAYRVVGASHGRYGLLAARSKREHGRAP